MLQYIALILEIGGSLGLFLYGMNVMSDGIQQTAGDRLQRVLNFMTGTRLSAIMTGVAVTAIIQSSSATTVMVVSFVNTGLLTLTQAIGVIMGANIGTTVTAWIVSLVGFSLKISALALPAIGVGFLMKFIKWKHRGLGEIVFGFGLLFLGLDFLTSSMPEVSAENFSFLSHFAAAGSASVGAILMGTLVGLVITLLVHSSSASTAIILILGYQGVVGFEVAAAMVLGANIGTTVDAALAAIGTKTTARRTALVHILFNVIGTLWALLLLHPLCMLVDWITPGPIEASITPHIAMFHTVFNILNTLLFFPFVKPFAALVTVLIKDKDETPHAYRLDYKSGSIQDTPELNIVRAEKEIRDFATLASAMYSRVSAALQSLADAPDRMALIDALVTEMRAKEAYADEMREELTRFLIECTRQQLNYRSEVKVSHLLRIIADLEDMTDDCYSVSLLLERSVKKDLLFKRKEMAALIPYMGLVEASLGLVQMHLGSPLSADEAAQAEELERQIDKSRDRLRKLGRKRIEAGENVKTELLFIDMVRRIENLGDYCHGIAGALVAMQ
ncbi:MAG: Na/Pi cotransporter family protein [Treponema sp.]|jgi:phosphate:Na+ symporter|nr:Na/Pi cotransporter family protein [Treponema sp.]